MGILQYLMGTDINRGVENWLKSEQGVLLDVRTVEEYSQGHIPGSINIPLDRLGTITEKIPNRERPLFVHCLSGGRSSRAVQQLKNLGYTTVSNIGGINAYQGKVIK